VRAEVAGWRLVEDDAGEVRLWSHLQSGETREEGDVPREVQAELQAAPPADGACAPSAAPGPPPPEPPPGLDQAKVQKPNLKVLATGTKQWPRSKKSPDQVLPKVTHLFLAERGLTALGDCVQQFCHALKVLHLQHNRLREMGKLPERLETLQLDGNHLWEMASWSDRLPQLQVLDLRGNSLTVVDGLRSSSQLRHLVLRGQRRSRELGLRFSPSALQAIAPGLRFLDVARNHLADISPLSCLKRLEELDVSQNNLASVEDVTSVVQCMPELRGLLVEGNPLVTGRRYRDDLILIARNLEELDGKPVGRGEHAFLGELRRRRRSRAAAGHERGPPSPSRQFSSDDAPAAGGRGRPRSGSQVGSAAHPGLPPLPGGRSATFDPLQAALQAGAGRRQRSLDRL